MMTRILLFFMWIFAVGALILAAFLRVEHSLLFAELSFNDPVTEEYVESTLPFESMVIGESHNLTVQFNTSLISPRELSVYVNGCIKKFIVNELDFSDIFTGDCSSQVYTLPASESINPGHNVISIQITGTEHAPSAFHLRPSPTDLSTSLLDLTIVFLISLITFILVWAVKNRTELIPLGIPLSLGLSLRYIYWISTHYSIRNTAVEGHLKNIFHLLETGRFIEPTAHAYASEPPLYYAFSSVFVSLLKSVSDSPEFLASIVQGTSFIYSCFTLVILISLSTLLFPAQSYSRGRFVYGLIVATFPALIHVSANISNDSLALLFCCWAMFHYFHWWDHPEKTNKWGLIWIIASLGLLTKYSSILLMLPFIICLFLNMRLTMRDKIPFLTSAILINTLIVGWFIYFQLQYFHEAPALTKAIPQTTVQFWVNHYHSAFMEDFAAAVPGSPFFSIFYWLGITFIIFSFTGWIRYIGRGDYFLLPMSCIIIFAFALQFLITIQYPLERYQSYQFISFTIVPFAYFFSSSCLSIRKSLSYLGLPAAFLFAATSAINYLEIYFTIRPMNLG